MLNRLRNSQFVRHVAVLASGTAIAQAITVLASPILTRLYTPADFGVFALFLAIVSSMTPAICGKYEVAIVVAKSGAHGKLLFGISFQIAFALSFITLLAILIFWNPLVALLNASSLGIWLAVVPLALFLNGVIVAFNYYSNRLHEYDIIAKSKLIQATAGVSVTIVLGVVGFENGLLIGSILGLVAVSAWLVIHYRQIMSRAVLDLEKRKRLLIRRYKDFPLYNASTGLLDGIAVALPVFFLMHYFPEAVVGYYALLLRVSQAPLGLISSAVSQVYLKKVSDLVNINSDVRPCLLNVSLALTAIVAPFTVLLTIFAPDLFAWVFGEKWRDAGVYAQILMPALALRFVVSTVSSTLGGTGNNRLGAIWKVTAFIVTAGMFVLLAPRLEISEMFVAMLITDIILYAFYYVLIWQAAGHPRSYQ